MSFWDLAYQSFSAAHRRLVAELEDMIGLPEAWVHLMLRLLPMPDHKIPMTMLAQELNMSSGGFTKLADRLENAGLIRREMSKDDRRKIFAVLTDDGIEITERAMTVLSGTLREQVLGSVSAVDLVRMSQTLRALAGEPELRQDRSA